MQLKSGHSSEDTIEEVYYSNNNNNRPNILAVGEGVEVTAEVVSLKST